MRMAPIAALLIATLLGACGSQPDLRVSVGNQGLPMVLASTSKTTLLGGEHGDSFPRDIPLSTIRASTPVTLQLDAGQGASEIRGWLYDKDSPAPDGAPTEEFRVQGRSGAYASRTIAAGRRYEVLVNVKWSGLLVSGEVTYVLRLNVETP